MSYEWTETHDGETIVNRISDVPEDRCELAAKYKNLSALDVEFQPAIENWMEIPWDAQCFMRSMAREILRLAARDDDDMTDTELAGERDYEGDV